MNQRADFIIPECFVDTNLVETLICTAGCNHQKGCNQVTKVMQEKFADRFAIGVIDADKRRPSYLNEFKEIASSAHLTLFRHFERAHYIILVYPAIDAFILSGVKAANIKLSDYDLSPEFKIFISQTKNVMSNKDLRFKKLFKTLENIGEFKLLKSLLSYLINQKYNAADSDLTLIFQFNDMV